MSIQESTDKFVQDAKKDINDGRAKTSPVNGRKGGRDFLPVQEWAEAFIYAEHTRDGIITLRSLAGQWYEFRGDYWHTRMAGDIESKVMGYLQENHGDACRISNALKKDVMENLKSANLCVLDSESYKIPCFLPTGETAMAWIPMKNAVINVEKAASAVSNGTALPPDARKAISPANFFTYGLDYDFDPAATCPKWEKYLEGVQPDPENRDILQMMAGLGLVPDCSYNVAFFLLGEGGTGKGTFINVLSSLIGKDNYCTVPLAKLADRFGLAPLTQKLLNLVGEMPTMPENWKTSDVEGMFKAITSGDDIPVEVKYESGYNARAIARMIFATNRLPDFTDRSAGVWDRIRIIPFNQRFRNTAAQNPHLSAELCEELPGIFNWALRGLAQLRKRKTFPETTEGEKIKDDHRSICDHERAFLDECAELRADGFVGKDILYAKYKEWIFANGYRPLGKGKFERAVKTVFPSATDARRRTEQGLAYCFNDIQLKSDI